MIEFNVVEFADKICKRGDAIIDVPIDSNRLHIDSFCKEVKLRRACLILEEKYLDFIRIKIVFID